MRQAAAPRHHPRRSLLGALPRARRAAFVGLLVLLAAACAPQPSDVPFATPTAPPTRDPNRAGLVIAVVGDFGWCATNCQHEQAVADLVHGWSPDLVIDVGDSTYSTPAPGRVGPDTRPYAEDVAAGRLIGVLGNEDYANRCSNASASIVRDALHLPAPGVRHEGDGLLDIFLVDSNCGAPDGFNAASRQAADYKRDVVASTARWRITVAHHGAYSSGPNGPLPAVWWMILPSIDLFLAGHDHDFEQLHVGGKDFVVDGAGGRSLYEECSKGCAPGSVWHDDTHYGAVRLTVTEDALRVEYIAVGGEVLHAFTLHKGA